MISIYGTIGPACSDYDTLCSMFSNGMTGMRLNLSHGSLSDSKAIIETVRRAAASFGITPELLMDMQGPELRVGTFDTPLELVEGAKIKLTALKLPETLMDMLPADGDLLLDDGRIHLRRNGEASAIILRGGMLKSRKSVAVPGLSVPSPALTEDDLANISLACDMGITGLMQPFVRSADDLRCVRRALDSNGCGNIKIMAKIENNAGINSLDELIPECDEIIIARGDLGNAVPLPTLPGVQKSIASACLKAGRRFMVVTQMLSSMEHSHVPTRAEVSDIFNAVLDGASSVMVTGETAIGQYPIEVIKYLSQTVKAALEYRQNIKHD